MVQLQCISKVEYKQNDPDLGLSSNVFYKGLEVKINGRAYIIPSPFTFKIISNKWVRLPYDNTEGHIEFGVHETDMTARELTDYLLSCSVVSIADFKNYSKKHSSGDTVQLSTKPIKVIVAFVEGIQYDVEILNDRKGTIKFPLNFNQIAGGNPVNVTVIYI